jgi:5'-nucleotidase/UDP-sugar diphosphatase
MARAKPFLFLLLWAILLSACHTHRGPAARHLVVLYTGDGHGHCHRFSHRGTADAGGLAARATLVKRIRQENPDTLLLDAGDLNTGMAESDLFRGKPDILGYNAIGYDAMVLGNHEFDHPLARLKEQMELAEFPFLSANVQTSDGTLLAVPFVIRQLAGLNVAVFGLTTAETAIIGHPDHIRDLSFLDEVAVARVLVPHLRERADVVIALTHLGIYEGFDRGSKRLAAEVEGIDLIVDGNTEIRLEEPIVVRNTATGRRTLIVQAWHWGLVLGRVDLWVRNREVVAFESRLIPVNLEEEASGSTGRIPEDPDVLRLLQPYVTETRERLSATVGHAEDDFDNRNVRREETAFGNLLADAMKWRMKRFHPDFAVVNSGAIRSDLPAGPISRKALHDALPFDSTVVLLRMSGEQVRELFRHLCAVPPGEGGFPQVSGDVRLTVNPAEEICDVRINGRPLDRKRTYRVVTNSYLARGGDGYAAFAEAEPVWDASVFLRDVLAEYINFLGGEIRPTVSGRIQRP